MANAFKAMGISLDDPAIKARNVEQILYSIANAASRMPDGAVKTAAFMAILGKSGAELIPTLNGGVLALKGMGAELHKLGAVMDDDSVQSLANMDKEVNKLKTAFTGLKDRAVIALLPELQSLADKMLKWIEANQDLINQRIPEIMREVVVVAKEIGSVLAMVTEHWKLLAGVVGAMTVLGAVSSVATTVSSLVGTVRLLTSAWSVMGTTGAGAFAGILGPLGLAIGSILLFNSRMSSHDSRDTIAGKNTDDVSWNEASQLRVDREAAPDVDSIVRAPKLTDDQLAARKAKPMSAETRAAVQSIQTGSAGARLSAFLQPTMISGGAPTDTASGTSGAAGPLLAATQSVPDAAANSPIIAVNVPNQRANTATNSITYAPNYQVAIDGSGLTPDQLKLVISDELRDHDERMRRDTAAALGVGGF
jgi:hypothetical protein